jgi:type II secretory pathway predicted ATPase ExeA
MSTEVLEHFGLIREFKKSGYYETPAIKQIFKDIKNDIQYGRLIVVTGIIGCGKTVFLRRLQESLLQENKVIVCRSLAVDKVRATIDTLISALFYDLSDKEVKVPTKPEKRERELNDLIKSKKKPVLLCVDEAHDLYYQTLTKIKRLMEVVEASGGILSVLLLGHPKLRNDLRRPTMEEIGYRAIDYSLDNVIGNQREYIEWLIKESTAKGTKISDLLDASAIELLASSLRTPLQIEEHLMRSFKEAFQIGEKPVTADVVSSVLSKRINDLEPVLVRNGYNVKSLAEQLNVKPFEIRSLFLGKLEAARSRELLEHMRMSGLPI